MAHVRVVLLLCALIAACAPVQAQGRLRQLFARTMTGELAPGEKIDTMDFGGEKREAIVHVPPGFPGNRKWPLVMLFHGGGGNAGQAMDHYRLRAAADRHGFVLVAPNGTGRIVLRTFNVKFGFGYAKANAIDDVGYVGALLARLKSTLPIDETRVFATGMSNGAILCHFLAAGLPGQIAAIAPVVGTVGGKAGDQRAWQLPATPGAPVSVMAINGQLDRHIPLLGGMQIKSVGAPVEVKSARETAQFWIDADGCAPGETITEDAARGVTIHRWKGGRAGTEVELWVVRGGGHAWPGGQRSRAVGDEPSTLFDANEAMWQFFADHPRR